MDAFLLTVYFLVVIYVLYQMALSLESRLEDKVIIHLDKEFAAEQTQFQLSSQAKPHLPKVQATAEQRGIKDSKIKFSVFCLSIGDPPEISDMDPGNVAGLKALGLDASAIARLSQPKIDIQVKPTGQQPTRELLYLTVIVNNRTPGMQVYLNWDQSSLEMFGQGNRVIRSTPNMQRDLSQAQIYSVVNPGKTVTSDITIEQNYFFDPEINQMALGQPLVDLKEWLKMSKLTDPTEETKNIQPLYSLDLMVSLKRSAYSSVEINLLIPFRFTLEIKPDQVALPPLRWLLRRTGKNRQRIRSWLWGK